MVFNTRLPHSLTSYLGTTAHYYSLSVRLILLSVRVCVCVCVKERGSGGGVEYTCIILTGGGIISSNICFPLKLTAAMRTLKDAS